MERRRRDEPTAAMLMLLLTFAISSSLAANATESRADYTGWKVLEVLLEGDDFGSHTLNKLYDMEEPAYLEILRISRNKVPGMAEVAVAPEALKKLRQQRRKNKISFSIVIHNLSKKLDTDISSLRADTLPHGAATFERFMNLNEIMAHLEELPSKHPNKVSLKKVGYSFERRPLYLVTVTSNTTNNNTQKPIIFVDGGVHAREWISPAAALNLISRLLDSTALTRNIEWRIMPLLNPDGYAFSWNFNRLWRKNRGRTSHWLCRGSDLNRNFGFHWGGKEASPYPCRENYRGRQAFSEPESRALRDAMLPIKDRIEAYISLHSYGQYFLHPWGYTSDETHYNNDELFSVGDSMAKKIKKKDGTIYTVGSTANIMYVASGTSIDWAAGALKIPLAYTMELRDGGPAGFVLPHHLIVPAVNDVWIALKYLGKYVIQKEKRKLAVDQSAASVEPGTRDPAEPEVTITQEKPV